MKALPQRPGPSGSRVIKKRASIPQLGDGLLTVFNHDNTPTKCTAYIGSQLPITLTSSNLNRLVKSTHSTDNIISIITPSVCSDEDVVLIGNFSQSADSKASSRFSFRSDNPRGDETPPTTLTGDDSFFFSDGETTLGSLSPGLINGEAFFGPESTLLSTSGSTDTAMKTKHHPLTTAFLAGKEKKHVGLRSTQHDLVAKPSASLEFAPIGTCFDYTSTEANAASQETPNAESLHCIVRGFLATTMKSKSASPSITDPQLSSALTPKVSNKLNPFWEPQRIFEFYIKGAITFEKAKETANRCGYSEVIHIIDKAEALRKENSSLHISDIINKVVSEVGIRAADHRAAFLAPAPLQQDQHDVAHDNFMLKLATYSAQDINTKPAKLLHIFVDMSNIHIGFCNSWKASQGIPVDRRVRAPAFNYKILACIMERNRAAKKKVLASSVACHVVNRTQWPQHFVDAEKQGYKTRILNRVQKISPAIKVGRKRKTSRQEPSTVYPSTVATSGDESAEDFARAGYETRNGEQGVDEILHLNMMDSILDDMQEPGTMILATGDAAQAEFSPGFLEYATRALALNWNLELVTWKSTISSSWTSRAFRDKHGERFRIIYLDEFLEELNADLCASLA
ncbi:putative cytochrome P450 9c1 [Rosellinia necatrix]|uniref:Putative cytochrome P450 9c1 n=1 Tax=Rosellinia necatrix TaxID=77044 RepID=A0A1W2TXF9_ROSNE|nr:putative cytochrome P450 9c1 [Rosellinia necatrix]